ncbi:Signal recognition particle receptor FtsY [invertebrate metagenome]|uniref:Signal recognition particle receptor FtsY n=1 Tax=invertebrate metagenome TaxID=1711999 RepID=A0A2H9TBY9_9ZZZZ
MFGSRNDDEKKGKRRFWPWRRHNQEDQSEEETPSSAAPELSVAEAPETDSGSCEQTEEPSFRLAPDKNVAINEENVSSETEHFLDKGIADDHELPSEPMLPEKAVDVEPAVLSQESNEHDDHQPGFDRCLSGNESGTEAQLSSDHQDAVEYESARPKGGLFARMKSGLSKTRTMLVDSLADIFIGGKEIDDDMLEELETRLLLSDVGVEATASIIEKLTDRVQRKELNDADAVMRVLKAELSDMLKPADVPLVIDSQKMPYVILVVGVNGVGKTTTIGKLVSRFQTEGKKVMLAAGDTFRAAAVEQLQVWGDRNHVPVVAQHTGADSASVIYDAFEAAKARKMDVLIADTAGRLHNKDNLMEELKKIKRVLGKLDGTAPHEVLLVLDAGTGQNALSQARLFHETVNLTGMVLTKLDGTAKGGIVFALSKQMQLPIRFLGVGEQINDLRPFCAREFIDALFDVDKQ